MLPEINPDIFELTVEQEFILVCCNQQIDSIPAKELRKSFLEMAHQLMIKENMIKMLVKARI